MQISCLEVGPLSANCYLIGDEHTGRGLVIDPGGDASAIVRAARDAGFAVELILNTHCHPDHTGANDEVRQRLAAGQGPPPRLLVHAADRAAVEHPPLQWLLIGMRPAPCPVDGELAEGQGLVVGGLRIGVLHVPGHSPGSVALVLGHDVFTGDTLFSGSIGRTDLPGGSEADMAKSLARLVAELPDDAVIWPGHGPRTTLGAERLSNPWLAD
jgi:hydroxyacylglutathione hydrolase